MTNNGIVTDKIITKYVIFLLDGFTINGNRILVGTIRSYLHAVIMHYKEKGFIQPFDNDSDHRTEKVDCKLIIRGYGQLTTKLFSRNC